MSRFRDLPPHYWSVGAAIVAAPGTEENMRNEEIAAVLTKLFREVVVAVNETLWDLDPDGQKTFELARRLHSIWREALRNSFKAPVREPEAGLGSRSAMDELLHLIDVEVKG